MDRDSLQSTKKTKKNRMDYSSTKGLDSKYQRSWALKICPIINPKEEGSKYMELPMNYVRALRPNLALALFNKEKKVWPSKKKALK